ncbi:MAG TPA: acetate--CoA ligase family protein [Ilumatobacter sp.]|nr:acetate--CoA ligase family protein [Ilumatobacter sp.]
MTDVPELSPAAHRVDSGVAIRAMLDPRSIAVIGASRDPRALAGRPFELLRQRRFDGQIHLVNRHGGVIGDQPVLTDVDQLPEDVDVALVLVPAQATAGVLRQCAARGVRCAYVFSSGFAERGDAVGRALQEEISPITAATTMRIGGPNGEGWYSVARDLPITFSPAVEYGRGLHTRPRPGNVALVAQSGGIGFGIAHRGFVRGVGFSHVITTGNEVDLELLDYTEALIDDPATHVIGLFVEGFAHPRRLEHVLTRAREADVAVVVARVGRSEVGSAAATSHTGHLAARPELVAALLRAYGAHEAADADELLDLCTALSTCDAAAGRRVAVYTLSGGAGAWIADTLAEAGLDLPELEPEVRSELSAMLPAYAATRNPVDVTASFGSVDVAAAALRATVESPSVDSAVIALSMIDSDSFAQRWAALHDVIVAAHKPVLVFSYTEPGPEAKALLAATGHPWYTSQRGLAAALRVLAARRPAHRPPVGSVQPIALPPGRSEPELKSWLSSFGLAVPRGQAAANRSEAERAASELGGRVVLKGQHPAMPHKTEAGLVEVGVEPRDVATAYDRIVAAAERAGLDTLDSVLVEQMAAPGVEMMVGLVRDDGLGTFVVVGRGGTTAELDPDVAIRPAPVSTAEALEMIDSLRGAAALGGWRGTPAADRRAFAELIATVSGIGTALGEHLDELDLNPVIVHPAGTGVTVVDALLVAGDDTREGGFRCSSN